MSQEEKKFENMHVYGGRGAMSFEATTTRKEDPSVTIDGAKATGPKNYLWGEKVSFQFTVKELPVLASVLLGIRKSCKFNLHGPNSDKYFELEFQGDKYYAKVGESKAQKHVAIPLPLEESFYITDMVLSQLMGNLKGCNTVEDVKALLNALYARDPAGAETPKGSGANDNPLRGKSAPSRAPTGSDGW